MTKEEFEYFISQFGEVKKACYIVREYLRCEIQNIESVISKDEYIEAVRILLAYTYANCNDFSTINRWYCENDCTHNDGLYPYCPGEFQLDRDSKKLCKYYSDPFFR